MPISMYARTILWQRRMPFATNLLEPFARWDGFWWDEPLTPKPNQRTAFQGRMQTPKSSQHNSTYSENDMSKAHVILTASSPSGKYSSERKI